MTPEPPSRPPRRPRPDPAFRRRSLGLAEPNAPDRTDTARATGARPGPTDPASGDSVPRTLPAAPISRPTGDQRAPGRPSLSDDLARIPDLDPDEDPSSLVPGSRSERHSDDGAGGATARRVRVDGKPPSTADLPPRSGRPDRGDRAHSPGAAGGPNARHVAGAPDRDPAEGRSRATPSGGPGPTETAEPEPSTAELFIDVEPAAPSAPGRRSAESVGANGTSGGRRPHPDATDTDAGFTGSTGPASAGPAGGPLVAAMASLVEEQAASSAPVSTETDSFEPDTIGPRAGGRTPGGRRVRTAEPQDVPLWRRVGFALLTIVLVAAIPLLARTGYRLVTESTDGTFSSSSLGPSDPGYEELVNPTPTSLIIQTDADGTPVSLTFVALAAEAGGSVIFLPLDTEVAVRAYGVDRLRTVYAPFSEEPALGRQQLASQVGNILNVAIEEVIQLDDRSWAQMVEPVGTLTLDNPDSVSTDEHQFDAGTIEITADQVGPYLAARSDGESDLSRLVRHEVFWRAWMEAHAEIDAGDAAPASRSVLGEAADHLVAGEVDMATLPVVPGEDEDAHILVPEPDALIELVASAVPAPLAPVPGARANVRVLNGVSVDPIPTAILHDIVASQSSVTVLGNATTSGNETTTIIYNDPAVESFARSIVDILGVDISPQLNLEAPDTVDITVVLGRDVLD